MEQRWKTEAGGGAASSCTDGGAVKSCLANRCYTESCLVGRCYARQIFQSLHVWTDERRAVAPLGVVVASTDVRIGKDDADLSPEDGSVVR